VCVFEGDEVGGAEEALLPIQLTPYITAYPEELGSIIISYFIHFYVLQEKTFSVENVHFLGIFLIFVNFKKKKSIQLHISIFIIKIIKDKNKDTIKKICKFFKSYFTHGVVK
jgi:hypothetical protein